MPVRKFLGLTLALSTLILLPRAAFAQEEQAADAAAMIASALSAAPEAITATATITDLDGNVLRQGTSGFTCMPDDPEIPGNGPICLDAGWQAFIYALQGGWPASNVDPYADGPTENNEWLGTPDPHIAVLVPDASMLEGISTDPNNGGPWIMWRDTPYAHLMIPAARKQ
jgi:hypothetical protein